MKKKSVRTARTYFAIFLIAISCLFQGCGNNKDEGLITLGTSLDYPPFEFSENGTAVGFDIDIANALAGELGYELEIKDIDFPGLIPALKSGRVDFVMAGLSENEERKRNVDFSNSYYKGDNNVLLHLKDKSFKSIEEVADKKIGTQQGSVQEAYLKELKQTIPSVEIVALGRNPNLVQEVKIGRIDALIISETQAKKFIEANSELGYSPLESAQAEVAIALKKDSSLTGKFNDALKKLESEGVLEELKTKWFK